MGVWLRVGLVSAALLGWLWVSGCRRGLDRENEQSNLKPLAVFYGRYVAQHRGQPPADEAQFKQFLNSINPSELAAFQVNSVESLFVSPRDGKPYVIVYGHSRQRPAPGASPVIAYEQEGKGGKRLVANALGAVEEVDQARLKQLLPEAK